MTLQASGPISLADIQSEFGGTNPIGLSEYYKGGTYVSQYVTAGIPASGSISMFQFYAASAVARPLVSSCIVSNQETSTTNNTTATIYLQSTNTTGVTQTYACVVYFNQAYYTTLYVNIPNGSQWGQTSTGVYPKNAYYGQVSQYPVYFICESVFSNTINIYIQYDSSPPPISYIQLTGSWSGTGPRTISITYNVYLTRLNLTGSSITYPLVVVNTDTPDLVTNSSIDVIVPADNIQGQSPTSFSSVNAGFQHYVTTEATGASGTITSTNSAYYQIAY